MQRLSYAVEELCAELNATLIKGNPHACACSFDIDSRRISTESLFIAITGEKTDGHSFLLDAHRRGAIGAIIDKECSCSDIDDEFAILKVDSSKKALEKLGALWRNRSEAVVIGITGSVGKTTAKNILAHILCERFDVLSTPANWNTEIGVPLTLGKLTYETEIAVIEMAMRGRGQIALLSNMARPDQATITNVRSVHLDLLGSTDEIVKAKLEIASGLSEKGTLWLNHDEPVFSLLSSLPHATDDFAKRICYDGEIRLFSTEGNADVVANDIQLAGLMGSTFELVLPDSRARVDFPLLGKGAVACVAAVAGVAWKTGMDAQEIAHRLASLETESGRLERKDTDLVVIIDDCYNASTDSVLNALGMLRSVQVFDRIPVAVVLGDMLELGDVAKEDHARVGRAVAALEPAFAIFAGDYCDDFVEGLSRQSGLPYAAVQNDAARYGEKFISELIVETRRLLLATPDRKVLLIKGSRSVGLDRLVNALTDAYESSGGINNA